MSYLLTKLTRDTQTFVFSFVGTDRSRSPAFSMAAATVVCSMIPDLDVNNRVKAVEELSRLNEVLRLNVDEILNYAAKFFKYRQSLACASEDGIMVSGLRTGSEIEDFFGISRFFTSADLDVIRLNARQISLDRIAIASLIRQLELFRVGK